MRYPAKLGDTQRILDTPIGTPDLMPTLLGLSGIDIPATVEGQDVSKYLEGKSAPADTVALIASYVPFHQWNYERGGREYRGIRTTRYTYVRDLNGPWLMYDNDADPYQMNNLVGQNRYAELQIQLDDILNDELKKRNDKFLSGPEYMAMWGYEFDAADQPKQNN
jgi:arylsulfatase A-like enzyme